MVGDSYIMYKIFYRKDHEGFSLAELLVVVVILVVLAVIATPLFLNQKKKASDAVLLTDLSNMASTLASVYTDTVTTVTGSDGTLSPNLTIDSVTIDKKGATVYANNTGQWCVSEISSSGHIFATTSTKSSVYEATASCTSPSSEPLSGSAVVATLQVHVDSAVYNENYKGVVVDVSKDGGPFTYKTGTTDASGDWNAGSIDPNATYQIRLTQPCDSHASETQDPISWGTGDYSPTLTLAATVPCAPVLSYDVGSDTMNWTVPSDGGSALIYYNINYNTPARLANVPPSSWGMFARYWPTNLPSIPFATYAISGCPPAGPAYPTTPQCLRVWPVSIGTPYVWRVTAKNSLPTAGILNPTAGIGFSPYSSTLTITR